MLRKIFAFLTVLACLAPQAMQPVRAQAGDAGMPRETIAEIQSMLAELGYRPGPADGIMGERTRSAIRRYQGSAGLPADGQASLRLRDALRVSTGRARGAPAPGARQPAWTGAASAALTLYARPAASSATARVLPAGTELDVYRRQGEWLEIRTRDGRGLQGWVSYAGVHRIEQAAAPP